MKDHRIIVKVIAAVLVGIMVLASAGTLLFYLFVK